MSYNKKAISLHKKHKGKIEIKSKVKVDTMNDLSLAYTPGVGAVCLEIAKDNKKSWELTNRANQVAIVSDGTAILGLGDIGPEAGMPVMEGKSVIFKEFAGIDAIPLCINTKNVDEIVNFCKMIEPSFAGINIEDISAPRCFEILERLEKELSIPVFHDDQDGTAIVVLAGLINSCKVLKKDLKKSTVVLNGSGAAGLAIARLLLSYGVGNLVLLDSRGILSKNRSDLNFAKQEIVKKTNKKNIEGGLIEAMKGADIFVGVSKGNLLSKDMVASMSDKSIVFAMANPVPEIMPDEAEKAGVAIVGTGRSDFANQINNALVFPGIFKGFLKNRKIKLTPKLKIKVAEALAGVIKKPNSKNILPKITDRRVVRAVEKAVIRGA